MNAWAAQKQKAADAVDNSDSSEDKKQCSLWVAQLEDSIKAIESQGGRARSLSLVPTYTDLKDVLKLGFEAEGSQYLYSALCVGAAAIFGFKGVQQSQRFGRR